MSGSRPHLLNRPPRRGEIWWVDFDPVVGHEQAHQRPALVVSADTSNQGPQQLVIVLPITRTRRSLPLHIWFDPDDTGLYGSGTQPALRDPGAIRCDQIRTVSLLRFTEVGPAGRLTPPLMDDVDDRLRVVLNLPRVP